MTDLQFQNGIPVTIVNAQAYFYLFRVNYIEYKDFDSFSGAWGALIPEMPRGLRENVLSALPDPVVKRWKYNSERQLGIWQIKKAKKKPHRCSGPNSKSYETKKVLTTSAFDVIPCQTHLFVISWIS